MEHFCLIRLPCTPGVKDMEHVPVAEHPGDSSSKLTIKSVNKVGLIRQYGPESPKMGQSEGGFVRRVKAWKLTVNSSIVSWRGVCLRRRNNGKTRDIKRGWSQRILRKDRLGSREDESEYGCFEESHREHWKVRWVPIDSRLDAQDNIGHERNKNSGGLYNLGGG